MEGDGITPSPTSKPDLEGVFAFAPTAPSMSFSKLSIAAAAFWAMFAMLPHMISPTRGSSYEGDGQCDQKRTPSDPTAPPVGAVHGGAGPPPLRRGDIRALLRRPA